MIRKGDRYTWNGTSIEVIRVSKRRAWADIHVTYGYGSNGWRKRQPLIKGQFPAGFEAVTK